MKNNILPLPAIRCLSKVEAATYLGVGVSLLTEFNIPVVKFGRRLVYDKVDLDLWLEDYKQRERGWGRKESLCPNLKKGSIKDPIRATGGLVVRSQMAKEYAKVLGFKTEWKPKHF